jgi:hypothetical protein
VRLARSDMSWKGFPVYTLTLEERHTCPRTCEHWRSCMGNHMPLAQRIEAEADLEWRLEREVALLSIDHVEDSRCGSMSSEISTTITVEHPYQVPADAILCPEQVGKTESCSTCGLCWATQRRIASSNTNGFDCGCLSDGENAFIRPALRTILETEAEE